jgi:Flp pilus assembly CpaF family ATPase
VSHEHLVVALRRIARNEVGTEVERRESADLAPMTAEDREVMARSILRRELKDQWQAAAQRGGLTLTPGEEAEVTEAVVASLFSALPGLDEYLARRDVTDIFVNGCDDVRLRLLSGEELRVPPIASSDDELVALVQGLARRGGHLGARDDGAGGGLLVSGSHQERGFSPANPILDLFLSDGSRLAAAAWVTERPYVSIRRHPLVDADQKDLVERWDMYDEGLASLLAAAVRARMSILVTGGQGSGKTTLLRALLHECDPNERIMVLEQQPELQLHATPERHNQALSWVERVRNMEGEGEVTLADLAWSIKRHNPDRIVVGEVRGPEVMDMLEAASQGIAGAMCTLHSKDSLSVFRRILLYARQGHADLAAADVLETASLALDLVVHLNHRPGQRRHLAEITHVDGFDADTNRVVTSQWFIPGPDGAAVANPHAPIPAGLREQLVDYGYDPSLHATGGMW